MIVIDSLCPILYLMHESLELPNLEQITITLTEVVVEISAAVQLVREELHRELRMATFGLKLVMQLKPERSVLTCVTYVLV